MNGLRVAKRGLRAAFAAAAVMGLIAAASAAGSTYSNPTSLAVPGATESGPASLYPSPIAVEGLPGTVRSTEVTLNSVTHARPNDIQVLLVGATGQKTVLMSDACGDENLAGVNLTFSDAAAVPLPEGPPCPSGTYKPADHEGQDMYPAPAPSFPFVAALSVFSATPPNGSWVLFVNDGASGGGTANTGTISGGWTLSLLPDVSCAGRAVTVAAHVGTAGDDVIEGTAGPDVLLGLGGNDTVRGLGGKDVICGGTGADKLLGGSGKDLLRGEAGKDRLKGQGGKDTCKGGGGRDRASACEKEGSI